MEHVTEVRAALMFPFAQPAIMAGTCGNRHREDRSPPREVLSAIHGRPFVPGWMRASPLVPPGPALVRLLAAVSPLGCVAAGHPRDPAAARARDALEHPVPPAQARDRDPGCRASAQAVRHGGGG